MNNIFSGFPGVFKGEVLEKLLDHGNVSIERVVLNSSSVGAGEWLCPSKPQWLMLMQGFVVLESESNSLIEIKAGDYLLLDEGKRHRVQWINPTDEAIWLSIQF